MAFGHFVGYHTLFRRQKAWFLSASLHSGALRAITRHTLGPIPYLMIFATTPAPTVLPPSRMANLSPSSIAIGLINSTLILMLSPGMIISVPAGSSIAPVTSVVRK